MPTLLSEVVDIDELRSDIELGFVASKTSPDGLYVLYDYTPQAQFKAHWTDATRTCRGLIACGDAVIARPFAKFFNYGQVPLAEIPFGKPAVASSKMDGSLGIYYRTFAGASAIATRGSFTSDQALWATKHWTDNYPGVAVPQGVTPLFEIIYPANRIVVDYRGEEKLVLLAVIDNATGADVPLWEVDWWPGHVAPQHPDISTVDDAYAIGTSEVFEDEEGIVLCWMTPGKPSFRLKVKHPEYIRLHRIITGVSNKTIWELLLSGQDLDAIIDRVPDEFFEWVRSVAKGLRADHEAMDRAARAEFQWHFREAWVESGLVPNPEQSSRFRAIFADRTKTSPYRALMFPLLNGKDIGPAIWKAIKPTFQRPFTEDTSD